MMFPTPVSLATYWDDEHLPNCVYLFRHRFMLSFPHHLPDLSDPVLCHLPALEQML